MSIIVRLGSGNMLELNTGLGTIFESLVLERVSLCSLSTNMLSMPKISFSLHCESSKLPQLTFVLV